ncbi:hypothetical protein FJZ36_19405, partial [Candidatus Poribacteria bacterium]|nr:hypothetical protein [Candidatus Poribacteria bacterium]
MHHRYQRLAAWSLAWAAALCVAGPIRAAIDPDSIAGLWLFDDKSAKDESGNKHDGKLQKNPIWTDGRFGGA